MAPFDWPYFYHYPPYFTIQPIQETADKQAGLWRQLILQYCEHQKVYILSTAANDEQPLFVNKAIERRLDRHARTLYLDGLVSRGHASWLDKDRVRCLILWKPIPAWANTIADWVQTYGQQDAVFSIHELSVGDDVQGSDLEGLPMEILLPALKLLSQRGKARLFQNDTGEQGVKFVA